MITLQDIEDAVIQLPSSDLGELRSWFAQFDADMWDREFEDDAKRGVLDRFADNALHDLADGRCTKL